MAGSLFPRVVAGAVLLCVFGAAAEAAQVTRAIRNVQVLPAQGAASAAKAGTPVPDGAALRTGPDARAELTFSDRTVTRLGGKTILRVKASARDLHLEEGAVLFHAPRQARGARIATGTITAAITGTTGLVERFGTAYFKLLVLEGTARVFVPKLGESVLVTAGQMLISKPDARVLPEPVHFNIEHLYRTSLLTRREFAPLPSHDAILQAIRKQKSDPKLLETNLIIYGRGTLVNLVESTPTPAAAKPPTSPARAGKR